LVESKANDWYVQTKDAQEKLVVASGLPYVALRPTLMFGWFDRKHIAWLARFMHRMPVFPIPGSGRYMRQPLYAGDFCDVIVACIAQRPTGKVYNISGQEKIDYIDLMRAVMEASSRQRWSRFEISSSNSLRLRLPRWRLISAGYRVGCAEGRC